MKQIFIVKAAIAALVFFSVTVRPASAQQQHKALFIGNSYTFYNDLPALINGLAGSTGDGLIYFLKYAGRIHLSATHYIARNPKPDRPGRMGLRRCCRSKAKIPSFPDAQFYQDGYPFALLLDSQIHAATPCAKTIFYMTWGRKNGDAQNCANFPPLCTYQGMDSMLQLRYTLMADATNAIISPVARVWRYLRTNAPNIELYDADGGHPSLAGSYASACAFYTVMFQKNPALCTYLPALSAADAATIRAAASAVVWDSLALYVPASSPSLAGYTHAVAGHNVAFTNTSQNATTYQWYFGDGDSSTAISPRSYLCSTGPFHGDLNCQKLQPGGHV